VEIIDGGSTPPRNFGQKPHRETNNGHMDVANRLSRIESRPGLFWGHGYIVSGKLTNKNNWISYYNIMLMRFIVFRKIFF